MFVGDNEGPVFYREIQKNAYLKRIPTEASGKLRPLGHKKPLKPMWTLLCVHNGRVPFLEQYLEPESTAAHRPTWRVCLRLSRHVTASVKPHIGDEYDFLVDTEHGPVRMLAPNWDSMQDWVTTLRTNLYELRALPSSENLYCAPPAPPAPRAAARDPTSPLPPTPPIPPDRVPGIDLTPITRSIEAQNSNNHSTNNNNNNSDSQTSNTPNSSRSTTSPTLSAFNPSISTPATVTSPISNLPSTVTSVTSTSSTATSLTSLSSTVTSLTSLPSTVTSLTSLSSAVTSLTSNLNQADIDISNWDTSLPSTSRKNEPKQSVAKICGQNICLDDSVLKRTVTDSDEEFFAEIDRIHDNFEFKQRVLVTNGTADSSASASQRNNVTVIEVSNKAPNTAIPIMGSDTVFDFNFKQNVTINPQQNDFVNIVNTENQNSYGTVFVDNDYGHLSLTTVSLTDDKCVEVTEVQSGVNVTEGQSNVEVTEVPSNVNLTDTTDVNGIYESLCMASTSNMVSSPLSVRKVLSENKIRKSSLPNLELPESAYEYLYPTRQHSNNSNLEGNSRIDLGNRLVERTQSHNVANENCNVRAVRSNIERSQSQNAYDHTLRQRLQNSSPKRNGNAEKSEIQPKPIWKRGLTELSLLSRLRGIGQKRQDSPTRQDERVTSSVKVVHRSRPETTRDNIRRRSNSLTNNEVVSSGLQSLRARQAAALRLEQRRGAAAAATLLARGGLLFCSHERSVWVARWGSDGGRVCGRAGDRVAAIAGSMPVSLAHARDLLENSNTPFVDILFHRVPLAKIYVINKKDREGLGIKLDNECTILSVEANSPASRVGLPLPGRWAVTEVNNRPVNIVKGGEDDMNRLSFRGTEVSILIQPSALVKKMRTAMKGKPLLSKR